MAGTHDGTTHATPSGPGTFLCAWPKHCRSRHGAVPVASVRLLDSGRYRGARRVAEEHSFVAPAGGSALCASKRNFFGLVILRHFLHGHRAKSVFEVFLKFLERFALGHDFGMLEQFPKPETFALPVDHSQFLGHKRSLRGGNPESVYSHEFDLARRRVKQPLR